MRVKLAALTIAIALLMLLPSSAKADTFVYNVTSTSPFPGALNVDVTFDLPTFQEFVTTTTFTTITSNIGPLTEFVLSGNSTGCSISTDGNPISVTPGPCFAAGNTTHEGLGVLSPSFTGTGTFSVSDPFGDATTVTITDISSGVPEPSSLLLLGCGLVSLLAMASFGTRIRRSAS